MAQYAEQGRPILYEIPGRMVIPPTDEISLQLAGLEGQLPMLEHLREESGRLIEEVTDVTGGEFYSISDARELFGIDPEHLHSRHGNKRTIVGSTVITTAIITQEAARNGIPIGKDEQKV